MEQSKLVIAYINFTRSYLKIIVGILLCHCKVKHCLFIISEEQSYHFYRLFAYSIHRNYEGHNITTKGPNNGSSAVVGRRVNFLNVII